MRYLGSLLAIAATLSVASPIHAGLFGLPKFTVEKSDDRFSTSDLTSATGQYNRISKKSIAGGVHIDASGVFVEPMVIKHKTDGKIAGISFLVHNETSFDTRIGAPLALGDPERITFLTGEGAPIALPIKRGDSKWGEVSSYNSVTNSASTRIVETGIAEVTLEQYQRILNATALAVKVEGSKRSMVYEVKDVAKTFIPNLKTFYDGYIVN